jgi:hypothetical protein
VDRLSDTPRVNEVVSAWAVAGTPTPQRVKALTQLAKRLERELRAERGMTAAYQRVNARRSCPTANCDASGWSDT